MNETANRFCRFGLRDSKWLQPTKSTGSRFFARLPAEDRVPVVDLVPVFRQHRDSILFVDSVHATKEGYALVAEALVPVIRQQLASKADPVGHR